MALRQRLNGIVETFCAFELRDESGACARFSPGVPAHEVGRGTGGRLACNEAFELLRADTRGSTPVVTERPPRGGVLETDRFGVALLQSVGEVEIVDPDVMLKGLGVFVTEEPRFDAGEPVRRGERLPSPCSFTAACLSGQISSRLARHISRMVGGSRSLEWS